MAQQQIGALAAIGCYTVDSDFETDDESGDKDASMGEEETDKTNMVQKEGESTDFEDVYIKEEPEDIVEEWSVDTVGARDPQEEVFMELQEVKVEIESEDESSSDSDSSSSDEEEVDNKKVVENEEVDGGNEGPPRTKNELLPKDLPPVEDLTMIVGETECQEVGEISSIVEDLVVVESNPGLPALDLESVLFLYKGGQALGKVFDVIGPVTRPFYIVRFNSEQHVKERGITKGIKVYFAPKTEHTTFVFLEQLMAMKISDASWCNDEEPPPQLLDYSDDEQERVAKKERVINKMVERGADESEVQAKKAKLEKGRRGGQDRGRGRGGNNPGYGGGQAQPSYCNNMYTAQTNPFYRAERAYDPRACGGGQISWGQYNVQNQYGGGQYSTPPPQFNVQAHHNAQSQYYQYGFSHTTAPPPTTTSSPHPALAGASWQSQYQAPPPPPNQYHHLAGNISRLQQPPLPVAAFGLPPPPPPPPQ